MRSFINKPQVSSGPPLTPTLAWFDPSNAGSVHATGSLLNTWDDLSGAGHHVTSHDANQATTGLQTINGRNALDLCPGNAQGNCASIYTGALTQAQPVTMLVVCKLNTAPAALLEVVANNSNNAALITNTGSWAWYAGSVVASATAVDLNAHVFGAIFNNAGTSQLFLDGALISSTSPGAAGFSATTIRFGINNSPNGWYGLLGEAHFFSSALTGGQYAAQTAYLKAKWGTP